MIISSLIVFLTSDDLRTVTNLRCKTFDIFLYCGILSSGLVDCKCCSVCGAVDLIDALKVALHICCSQRSFVYGESSRNANHTMESYFLEGRGRGK